MVPEGRWLVSGLLSCLVFFLVVIPKRADTTFFTITAAGLY